MFNLIGIVMKITSRVLFNTTFFRKDALLFCRLMIMLCTTLPLAGYAQDVSHHHQQNNFQTPMNDANHSSVTLLNEHHGKWQFRVKYWHMAMEGLLDGSRSISTNDVFNRGFKISPTQMSMDTTMFSLMVMASPRLHLMVMLPYSLKSMDHITKTGIAFTTQSQGIGDTAIKGAYTLLQAPQQRLLVRFGLSLPTGSIHERDNTPSGNQRLPYPMQLGSGTFDPLFGFEYVQQVHAWLWGIAGNGVERVSRNQNNYAFGNRWRARTWLKKQVNPWLQTFVQLNGMVWGNVRGADPALNPKQVPTADPDLQGGRRIDFLVGAKFLGHHSAFKNQQLEIVFGVPLYQHLNGPQLKTRWMAGVQWTLA